MSDVVRESEGSPLDVSPPDTDQGSPLQDSPLSIAVPRPSAVRQGSFAHRERRPFQGRLFTIHPAHEGEEEGESAGDERSQSREHEREEELRASLFLSPQEGGGCEPPSSLLEPVPVGGYCPYTPPLIPLIPFPHLACQNTDGWDWGQADGQSTCPTAAPPTPVGNGRSGFTRRVRATEPVDSYALPAGFPPGSGEPGRTLFVIFS